MTAYRVTARRSGDWWALQVPGLPGVFSQAKRLDTAATAAQEAIAVMLDIEPEDVQVTVEPVLTDAAARAVADAEAARRIAEAAAELAQAAMHAAAVELTKTLSQRDAGRVLRVSFQRISQLLKAQIDAPSSDRAARLRDLCSAHLPSGIGIPKPKTPKRDTEKRPARQKERERV